MLTCHIGRRLIEEIAHCAPRLRLIFRQTHSQIVAQALMERSIDLAITAGGFAERLLSRQVLGEGDYLSGGPHQSGSGPANHQS